MIMLLTMISAAMVLPAFAGPAYADQHGKTVFLTIASFNGNLGGPAVDGSRQFTSMSALAPITSALPQKKADVSETSLDFRS